MSGQRLYFVAAEPSGDLLAAEVIDIIQATRPETSIAGIGGLDMAARAIHSPLDISELAILGLFEGLKAYPKVVKLADAAADAIIQNKPDKVILVDSWGFSLRVAQRVRKRAQDIKLIKLVGPQVWATREGRAKTVAETYDALLCLHDIEVPFYQPFDMPVTVIGNPALSRSQKGNGAAFRATYGISDTEKLLLILPGSRRSEIERVAPALIEAAKLAKTPGVRVIVAPATNMLETFKQAFPNITEWADLHTDSAGRYDAMAAADVALACSGTVTTELAMQGAPMIVAYKTGWVTWAIARGLLYKKTHITLLNIASDDTEIVPEFVQTKMEPAAIAAKVTEWLSDAEKLDTQKKRQHAALLRMGIGGKPAAEIAANAILES